MAKDFQVVIMELGETCFHVKLVITIPSVYIYCSISDIVFMFPLYSMQVIFTQAIADFDVAYNAISIQSPDNYIGLNTAKGSIGYGSL